VPTYGDTTRLADAPPRYDDLASGERGREGNPSVNAPNEVFRENEFGEIHRSSTDPDLPVDDAAVAKGAPNGAHNHFAEDTATKAQQYQSDEVYEENRFGEIGRADTFQEHEHSHLSEKLKDTAGRLMGKFSKKSPSPTRHA